MEPTDNLVPIRRPHFELRGAHLHFLISTRPHAELDATDVELWQRIDGDTTLGQLRTAFPDANDRIGRLWEPGVLELAEPTPDSTKPRRHVLVIEPHMDDAVLSVGGVMWQQRHECEFTVLSVAGRSNFTSYWLLNRDYFDVDAISALRRAESGLVMRLLGGHHMVLDRLDGPLRYQPGNWSPEWVARHRRSVGAFLRHSSTDAEVDSLTATMVEVFAESAADEVWIPLGIGNTADHELTRNACLRALLQHQAAGREVTAVLYQDVPYALRFPHHTGQIVDALTAAGGRIERVCDDIGDAMPAKLRLASVYGSQFKMSHMEPEIRACARQATGNTGAFGEIRFRVKQLPTRIDAFSLYSGRDAVQAIRDRMQRWVPRHRNTRRIRILCPDGIGRIDHDLPLLLDAFPRATIELHLSADSTDEAARFTSPRVEIRPVGNRKSDWARRIMRLAVSWPRPLIVLTVRRRRRLEQIIRTACALSDPLLADTLDHVVQAISSHTS